MTGKRKAIPESLQCPASDRTLGVLHHVSTTPGQLRDQCPFSEFQCCTTVHPPVLLMHSDTTKFPLGAAETILPTNVSCAGGAKLSPIRTPLKIIKFSSAIRVEYSESCNFHKDNS